VSPASLLRSTSLRLIAWYAGMFVVSVAILLTVVYWITRAALEQQLTDSIEREMSVLVDIHRVRGLDGVERGIQRRITDLKPPRRYFLLQSASGEKIEGNIPAMAAFEGWSALPIPAIENPGGVREDTETGHSIRALGRRLPTGHFLMVGENDFRTIKAKEAIVTAVGWGVAITALLAIAGGILLGKGFLLRIEDVNRTSRAIIDGDLSDRVPTRGSGDEMDRLAVNLNAMLDRIQSLMESVKRVSDDVAHDLRTPLSRLRHRLEIAAGSARAQKDCGPAIEEAIDEVDAILETFAALLRIAQIEAGTRRAAFGAVNLGQVAAEAVQTYSAVAEDRGQRVKAEIGNPPAVQGDRELLTQMIVNLIENSIRHCPAGTQITVGFSGENGESVLSVADTGPGIPPSEREKVLRRFYRLETSRTTSGSGLGLALVKAVADLHGASLELAGNDPGLTVLVRFHSQHEGRQQPESARHTSASYSPAL
jgi:signal transduction histidine kinase